MGIRCRNDVDATSLRRIDVITMSCACWEFWPPNILNLGPPNILKLPTPMFNANSVGPDLMSQFLPSDLVHTAASGFFKCKGTKSACNIKQNLVASGSDSSRGMPAASCMSELII